MKKTAPEGIYTHNKGSLVRVLFVALDSETQEEMMVYVHLDDGTIWVRPKKMFEETIESNGKSVPRFAQVKRVL